MDPRDFLLVARNLFNNATPGHYRTAINRSYYASYNVAANLLEKSGVRIAKNATGHGEVSKCLGNCGISDLEEAQSKLSILANQRIKADYRLNDSTTEKNANALKAIVTSENLIKMFDSYASNAKKKEIAKGVQKYKSKISSASKPLPKS